MRSAAIERPVDVGSAVRVSVHPLASALPIGLLALTTGSILLSGSQLHWASPSQSSALGWCLLAFVAPLQVSAFVFAMLAHDEGAASGLAVLSGAWAATGLVTATSHPGSRSAVLGVLLCTVAGAVLVPAMVTAASKPLMTVVLALIGARFAITGVYQLNGSTAVETVSGVLGLVVAGVGWYAAAAFALEDGYARTVLPTFRRRRFPPVSAVDDERAVADEAGVRARL
jgi:uncharacterized protein